MQRVVLVGAGRLGTSLMAMRPSSVEVRLVRSADPIPQADVVWLTVPDRHIAEVAARVPMGPLVLHASGASGLDVLLPHRRRGSLHPLMTFPGPALGLPNLNGVGAAVETADPGDLPLVEGVARAWGLTPFRVPGDRALYHAAAVLAGNAATVLLAHAGRILAEAGVPAAQARAMLAPLAHASLQNAVANPWAALTGPAARGDLGTLEAHRAALLRAGLADSAAVYDVLMNAALQGSRADADDR